MRLPKQILIFGFVAIWVVLLLGSCSLERKLALEFVENEAQGTPVMIVPAELLYMFNNKPITGVYNEVDIDSLSFHQSTYLQYVSDSIFLEYYYNAFINKSQDYGLVIFLPDQVNSFIEKRRSSYIIRMAQMELVEDTSSVLVEEIVNNRSKELQIPLDKIVLSTWFEISQKDSTDFYSYYDEYELNDEILGAYTQGLWDSDIRYDYTTYPLKAEEIYSFAAYMGKRHAEFLFDLILNSYIWNRLPKEKKKYFHYIHYNGQYHSVEMAEEAFIMME